MKSIRDEYAIELIRTNLYYIWKRRDRTGDMIGINEKKNGMWNRLYKAGGKRINKEEFRKIIEEEERGKRDKNRIIKYVKEKFQEEYINKWRSKKVSSEILKGFEDKMTEQKKTNKVWKGINVIRKAYIQIKKNEEKARNVRVMKALMKHDMRYAICPICNKITTIDLIVLNCIITKKTQMNKHDRKGEYIWRSLKIKYQIYENKEEEERRRKYKEINNNERRIRKKTKEE